jgi:predicted NBD/HSP70 family sugar kinase
VRILVVDVGGNNIKLLVSGHQTPRKVPSGPDLTPGRMGAGVKKAVADWKYDAVTIGFPGPVKDNRPAAEPKNLGRGWVRFDYRRAFGKPVRMINDAAMQALGSYNGGRMLFLGLGTGLGVALVLDGVLHALELAHLPYRNGKTYEDFIGKRGQDRMGKKRWRRVVSEIVTRLREAFQVDDVVLGGGNSKQLKELPPGARLGNNANAFAGGFRLWADKQRRAKKTPASAHPPRRAKATSALPATADPDLVP